MTAHSPAMCASSLYRSNYKSYERQSVTFSVAKEQDETSIVVSLWDLNPRPQLLYGGLTIFPNRYLKSRPIKQTKNLL